MGDLVYVQHGRYGPYVRKAPVPGNRKEEPAFKNQYSRTAYLNRLAGAVNKVMYRLAGELKSRKFYEEVQRQFRMEPEDNRLLLLRRLVGKEANRRYAFRHHAEPEIAIVAGDSTITVTVAARKHPVYRNAQVNCYTYEVALTIWREDNSIPHTEVQTGSWLPLKGPGALFEFEFAIPEGARHWMVCIKLCTGMNNMPNDQYTGEGALIYQVGSFDAAEQAWLQSLPPVEYIRKTKDKEKPAPPTRIPALPLPEAG